MSIRDEIRDYWDVDAETYDSTPQHRPTAPAEQAAWASAVSRLLPTAPARVLDCGAGTGFLSLIAARIGHEVTALDLSTAMLARLRDRSISEGLEITIVEGSANEPPSGPFDAVMERHLLWTLPDPLGALTAWREVAPNGTLILFEGLWGGADQIESIRSSLRRVARQLRHIPDDHHAPYSDAMYSALPLGRGTHPSVLLEMVATAGWRRPRLERLRDVEWAATLSLSPLDRLLGVAPRYVIVAS